MCYLYFRMWLSFILRDGPQSPRFPTVPTLFLYGNNKRAMFHDKKYNFCHQPALPSFLSPPAAVLWQHSLG